MPWPPTVVIWTKAARTTTSTRSGRPGSRESTELSISSRIASAAER